MLTLRETGLSENKLNKFGVIDGLFIWNKSYINICRRVVSIRIDYYLKLNWY